MMIQSSPYGNIRYIVSTKHLLTTNSEEITFNDEFSNFFTLLGGEINPKVNENTNIPDIEDWAIKILPEEMLKMEEMDDDSLYNTYINSSRFFVVNIVTGEEREIKVNNDKEIFISEDIIAMIKKDKKGLVYFKNLDDDVKLFEVDIENNELTKPLHELMALLNNSSSKDLTITLSDMAQRMLDILIEANIKANVISAELIINRLVRSLIDPYKRPDFSRDELEPYTIRTVNNALENNKSPLVGLSFQNIKRQLLSDELYTERNGSSYIDPFYKEQVSTDNYKEYNEILSKIGKKK